MNEMNENTLVLIVVIGLVIGFTYKIFYQIAAKRLPPKSLVGFSSIKDITYYYKSALCIISEKRWLIWLPLGFALSNYIVRIPMLVMQRSVALKSFNNLDLQNFSHIQPFFEQIIEALFGASTLLAYGYNGAIAVSYFFLLLVAVCAIILMFKNKSNELQQYISDKNIEKFIFLKRILKNYLIGLLYLILLGILCVVFIEGSKLPAFSLVLPILYLWSLLGLSLLSLIEGFILFTVKRLIEGISINKEILLNDSLAILKPLFYINITLSIILGLSIFVTYPSMIAPILNIKVPQILYTISSVLNYSNSLVVILTVCVPFVLINQGGTFKSAFLINFKFMVDNLFKYFQFICVAILIMFSPSLLRVIISSLGGVFNELFNPLSYYSLMLDSIVTTLQVLIAVPIYIALFHFFSEGGDRASSLSNSDPQFLRPQKTATL